MITLLLTVFLVVLISAICSMTEAALYSVPWTYIENLRKQGSATGERCISSVPASISHRRRPHPQYGGEHRPGPP